MPDQLPTCSKCGLPMAANHDRRHGHSPDRAITELSWLIARGMDSISAKAEAEEYLAEIEGAMDACEDTVVDLGTALKHERGVSAILASQLARAAEAFEHYANHEPACPSLCGTHPCSCGYAHARTLMKGPGF
jgi:hypothetical protein